MNIKKFLIGSAVGALMLGSLSVSAFAASQGKNLNASKCDNSGKPVVNITYKIVNDEDSGVAQNPWATDNYNKKVQVWDQGDGSFCAIVKYEGQFVTLGPKSPQNGDLLSAGIKGTFEGGYQATFNGTFDPGASKTNGNLGTFDQQAGGFNYLAAYFPDYTAFAQPYWSWTYHAGNNGTWVNAVSGNSGDITGN